MPEYYEIKISGHLDPCWSDWFAGLKLTHLEGDGTLLSGPLPDQAALHGLIERVPKSHRYIVTQRGQQVALWFTRCHARLFRPALGELLREDEPQATALGAAVAQFDKHVDRYLRRAKLQTAS